jgi:ribonuclease Z
LDGDRILIDCGPAVTQKLARAGFAPGDVSSLFFTHHHFDHNADYAAFAISRWDQGADLIPDLRVFGPWPTSEVTERLFGPDGAFAFDLAARLNQPPSQIVHVQRGGTLPRRPMSLDVKVLDPHSTVETRGWGVRMDVVEHAQPYLESLAYRFEWPSGSIVFSGDTRPCRSLVDLAAGADTLVMFCWDEQSKLESLGLDRWHTGTESAGRLAAEAGVRRLILTHINDRLGTVHPEVAIEQARMHFSGEVIVASELMTVGLADHGQDLR